jgi:tagaturonate reductase
MEAQTVLNRNTLPDRMKPAYDRLQSSPVTVLQIGEGRFLRGFADWMLHECRRQGLYAGSVVLTQPRPAGASRLEALRRQDGLYTLLTRGLENGTPVERRETIAVFKEMIDPFTDWEAFLRIAELPTLQVVISNTTEAGLRYEPEEREENRPVLSFPGRITAFLYHRYRAFDGDPDRGLILLPCELLERNGDELLRCVLRYCEDWRLPHEFRQWVERHNRFLNSLVDRIVPGYPAEEAEALFREWGCRDSMLITAEPYHLWAIEAEPELDAVLPFRRAGFQVLWVDDLTPYQQRKVRLLNGGHTLMAPLGIVLGLTEVREVMEHDEWGKWLREAVLHEIIPAVPMPADELREYAKSVFDRFGNPFVRHRLQDIAMNTASKFRTRLLPTIEYYMNRGTPVPDRIARGLAGLLRYYRTTRRTDGTYVGIALTGQEYIVNDDVRVVEQLANHWSQFSDSEGEQGWLELTRKLLSLAPIWGADLSAAAGLVESVADDLRSLTAGCSTG